MSIGPGVALAVGSFTESSGFSSPLVERWDGQSWKAQGAPHLTAYNDFAGVAAIGSVRWAVGAFSFPNPGSYTLAEVMCAS